MIDPSTIQGKRLAMIAWGEKSNGSSEVVVFSGIADWDGTALTLRRKPDATSFVIPAEWLSRIQPVQADLKSMLCDADYSFSVTVGNLGDDEDLATFLPTGLKWPNGEEAG